MIEKLDKCPGCNYNTTKKQSASHSFYASCFCEVCNVSFVINSDKNIIYVQKILSPDQNSFIEWKLAGESLKCFICQLSKNQELLNLPINIPFDIDEKRLKLLLTYT